MKILLIFLLFAAGLEAAQLNPSKQSIPEPKQPETLKLQAAKYEVKRLGSPGKLDIEYLKKLEKTLPADLLELIAKQYWAMYDGKVLPFSQPIRWFSIEELWDHYGFNKSPDWKVNRGELHLSGYNIEFVIGLNKIPNVNKATYLNLSNNKIKALSQGMFDPVKDTIETIILDKNPIKEISGNPFKGLNQLKRISLVGNQLNQDQLKQLRDLLPKNVQLRINENS